jgi:hypothetical protein
MMTADEAPRVRHGYAFRYAFGPQSEAVSEGMRGARGSLDRFVYIDAVAEPPFEARHGFKTYRCDPSTQLTIKPSACTTYLPVPRPELSPTISTACHIPRLVSAAYPLPARACLSISSLCIETRVVPLVSGPVSPPVCRV